jgi:hypothetical protein
MWDGLCDCYICMTFLSNKKKISISGLKNHNAWSPIYKYLESLDQNYLESIYVFATGGRNQSAQTLLQPFRYQEARLSRVRWSGILIFLLFHVIERISIIYRFRCLMLICTFGEHI